MAKRPCLNCGTPTNGTRCPRCARAREKARGTRQQRGYDQAHQNIRAWYQRRMREGHTYTCWRCNQPIDPTAWMLGHCDTNRDLYHGPECIPCNTATSGRTGECPHPSHAKDTP